MKQTLEHLSSCTRERILAINGSVFSVTKTLVYTVIPMHACRVCLSQFSTELKVNLTTVTI